MRVAGSEPGPGDTVPITYEGRTLGARRGESIAAALTAAGIREFRISRTGAVRGLFCGMGVCHECLIEVDGVPNVRACMTKVAAAMAIRQQRFPPHLAVAAVTRQPARPEVTEVIDVLVVGGGAAGLTAASVAAEAGARVVLVDERPTPGGQFYKQPATEALVTPKNDDEQFERGRGLMARADRVGVVFVAGAVVAAQSNPLSVMMACGDALIERRPRTLIIAAGAYEQPLPVSGWTLPGVMTTGAAQTLLRSYQVLPGRRILIAGNGPLNLQVAVELAQAGATVVGVAELSAGPRPAVASALLQMAVTAPALLGKGASYRAALKRLGIPMHYRTVLRAVKPGLTAVLADADTGHARTEVGADVVCMNYGFQPANELLRLLQCQQSYDERRRHLVTVRDAACRTTVPGVFAAGDCCGLNGAHVAMADGVIAGLAAFRESTGRSPSAALETEERQARVSGERHRRFQEALWTLFAGTLPDGIVPPESLVCRCEEIAFSALDQVAESGDRLGSLKRRTRLGMGRCQGRYCVPAAATVLSAHAGEPCSEDWYAAPRPPLRPTSIGTLAAPREGFDT